MKTNPLANRRFSGDLEEVRKSTIEVLTKTFENVKSNAAFQTEEKKLVFFPDGIELISVVLKFSTLQGFDVEVKIAGAKGVGSLAPGA